MAEITAALVKSLRDKTDAGMMDCKKALIECDGDMDAAVKFLREKGIAKAAAKADREANQGIIAALVSDCGCDGILLELNCETDFCAKGDKFQSLVAEVAKTLKASEAKTLEEALQVSMGEGSVEEYIKAMCSSIGENMMLRKFARLSVAGNGAITSYIHMGGKVGVLLSVASGKEETAKSDAFKALSRISPCTSLPPLPRVSIPPASTPLSWPKNRKSPRLSFCRKANPSTCLRRFFRASLRPCTLRAAW